MTSPQSFPATPQHPLGSGFTARSSADDVLRGIDLSGTVAVVTGGYSGLGLETTRALSGHAFACRSDPIVPPPPQRGKGLGAARIS